MHSLSEDRANRPTVVAVVVGRARAARNEAQVAGPDRARSIERRRPVAAERTPVVEARLAAASSGGQAQHNEQLLENPFHLSFGFRKFLQLTDFLLCQSGTLGNVTDAQTQTLQITGNILCLA